MAYTSANQSFVDYNAPSDSVRSTPAESKTNTPGVRFADNLTEAREVPQYDLSADEIIQKRQLDGATEAELRELANSMHGASLQGRRASLFNFEPISLPVSRVNSREDSSREPSRQHTHTSSGHTTPSNSQPQSRMHSPPLTPATTQSKDAHVMEVKGAGAPLQKVEAEGKDGPQMNAPSGGARPSADYSNMTSRHSTSEGMGEKSIFSVGPGSTSQPSSRNTSPNRSGAPSAYSRPVTPAGDLNDPYAARNRMPPVKNRDQIEARFVFQGLGNRNRVSPSSSSTNLPRSSTKNSAELSANRRNSSFLGHSKNNHLYDDGASSHGGKTHGSMAELKRFLKIGGHHKEKKRASSPSKSSGTKTPPHRQAPQSLPFGDDHGMISKYGKFGKVLGAGAGGSVRLMKRPVDGTTFAVKQFRERHAYETEKEYAKKVTAEFCVGSSLHHCNIIETLDIINEKGRWYEVMEYAPYDLFAVVMTGKMQREEVTCSFLQILSGVTYLHSMGLAHRDLKLDNVVVNEYGIMKIIDFGSASVFRYPFENDLVLSSGIVGSDPYLAPEVYEEKKYDPQPADIWSLAIIYCCMTLRRFPWKMPRMTDNSYKLFASPPSPESRRLSQNPDVPPADPVPGIKVHPSMVGLDANGQEKKPEVIKGPWRLMRLMPRESRNIIGRMLTINPRERAQMGEILDDPWVKTTPICRQLSNGGKGEVVRAPGHTHTLEPPASASTGTGAAA